MTITTEKLAELKRRAESLGGVEFKAETGEASFYVWDSEGKSVCKTLRIGKWDEPRTVADFIAAANPQTILSLIALAERALQPEEGQALPKPENDAFMADVKKLVASVLGECYLGKLDEEELAAKVKKSASQLALPAGPNPFPERDMSKPAEQQGIFRKFDVRRVDGSDAPGGKHHGCRYFVIDLDHDQHAPAAMAAYGLACTSTHPQLSADILAEFHAPAGPVPEGLVLVPMHLNAEMRDVLSEEDWTWEDLLVAANAVTEEQYYAIQNGDGDSPAVAQPEPDWSASKTLISEAWKNPLTPMGERLQIADGAVRFRDDVIANLRKQLAEVEAKAAVAQPVADEREGGAQ
ncbi:hypothetical protein [Herbaspirillum huttiense]|uniref:hypothetical protein n=1 Tax=Herbaspirillum huttiense TaxID=863372 RepID=UPI003B3B8F94